MWTTEGVLFVLYSLCMPIDLYYSVQHYSSSALLSLRSCPFPAGLPPPPPPALLQLSFLLFVVIILFLQMFLSLIVLCFFIFILIIHLFIHRFSFVWFLTVWYLLEGSNWDSQQKLRSLLTCFVACAMSTVSSSVQAS